MGGQDKVNILLVDDLPSKLLSYEVILGELGENLILLVNLAWSAVLHVRFLRGRGSFASLEKWQTDYLPVYAAWAAVVAIVFPPLFGFR